MDNATRKIISILVNNQPGVLSRIAGLFSRRGYNIDGLTVCATQNTVKQIVAQLEKQEDVVKVMDLDPRGVAARDLLLIKVAVSGAARSEIVDLCTVFGAKAVDVNPDSMMLELTGSTDKVDSFVKTLAAYDIIEMARTGGAALERGSGSLRESAELN